MFTGNKKMETYDVPRPVNFNNGYEENSAAAPTYVNVRRTVDMELRYIAMQDERGKESHDTAQSEQARDDTKQLPTEKDNTEEV